MIPLLVKTLERVHNKDLLLLVVSFLKKLAIFIENVLDMVRALNPLFFQGVALISLSFDRLFSLLFLRRKRLRS